MDSFAKKDYALYEDVFSQVTIKDFTLTGHSYRAKFCISSSVRAISSVSSGPESYSKLIEYSMTAYKRSRGTKVKFKYDTLPVAGTPERTAFDALINEKIGKWLTGDNAALPLGRGQEVTELTQKTYSSESTRDIPRPDRRCVRLHSKGARHTPGTTQGDVQGTSDATDYTLTFCIDPSVDMLGRKSTASGTVTQGCRQRPI